MSSWSPLEKRASAHTAYRVPFDRSTAMSGMSIPARMGAPVSGSKRPTARSFAILIGCDQVRPASWEIMTPSKTPFGDGWTPEPRPTSKMSTRSPFGSTAIWFPIVKMFWFEICTGGDQVAPPSVVRENMG